MLGRSRLLFIVMVIALASLLVACGGGQALPVDSQPPADTEPPPDLAPAESPASPEPPPANTDEPADIDEPPSLVVNFDRIAIGDTFGNFTVTAIGPAEVGFPFGPGNIRVEFSGTATVMAEFHHFEDMLAGDNSLWIGRFTEESAAVMPVMADLPDAGLLIGNYDAVSDQFPPVDSMGSAVVVISNLVFQFLADSDLVPVIADAIDILDVSM